MLSRDLFSVANLFSLVLLPSLRESRGLLPCNPAGLGFKSMDTGGFGIDRVKEPHVVLIGDVFTCV